MIIKLEQFEGPLALLVSLIDKAKLDITEVSLAKVTDQYLSYLRAARNMDPTEMADFLTVASRLLLIKTKALLPYLLPEEEEAIEEFEDQLRMYREFLEASKKVEAMVAEGRFMYAREFNRRSLIAASGAFAPPKKLKASDLADCYNAMILSLAERRQTLTEAVIRITVSLEEKIADIKSLMKRLTAARFSDLVKASGSKVEVVVSFLALLELVKLKQIIAEQSDLFSEIELIRK